MKQQFFTYFYSLFITEDTIEKVSHFKMPQISSYFINGNFNEQNVFLMNLIGFIEKILYFLMPEMSSYITKRLI